MSIKKKAYHKITKAINYEMQRAETKKPKQTRTPRGEMIRERRTIKNEEGEKPHFVLQNVRWVEEFCHPNFADILYVR